MDKKEHPLKGNQFWRLRKDMTKDGRKLSVNQLWKLSNEYIDYCLNNPIIEEDYKGNPPVKVEISHIRMMTIEALCVKLGILPVTLREWKKDPKYSAIINSIENIFYSYNIEGAAAGLISQNIVARKLGLAEKAEIDISDKRKTVDELFPSEDDLDQ